MPTRQTARVSPQPRPQSVCESVAEEAEEPMRIWPHPICPQACSAEAACPAECACSIGPDCPCPDLGQVLEQLQCQNQLLVDLLGAVNSLTAALLCRNGSD